MRSKLAFRWIILALAWLIYFSFDLIYGALAPLVTRERYLLSVNKSVIECFTILSTLAMITKKIGLGSLVAYTSYIYPPILA